MKEGAGRLRGGFALQVISIVRLLHIIVTMKIEKLFRISLITTFFVNMAGAITFIPSFHALRELGGLPEAGDPFYSIILALWIFFFGILYLLLAFSKTQERFFVLIGALGKSSFAILLAILALTGQLPLRAASAGTGDLIIAIIFFAWLYKTRSGNLIVPYGSNSPELCYGIY